MKRGEGVGLKLIPLAKGFWRQDRIKTVLLFNLKGVDTFRRYSDFFSEGDNFCNVLFAFLSTEPFGKVFCFSIERFYSSGENLVLSGKTC